MTNDDKYQEYLKKNFFRYSIIGLSILTIILELLALFGVISFLWGLISFALCYVAKYFYTKKSNTNESKKNNSKK